VVCAIGGAAELKGPNNKPTTSAITPMCRADDLPWLMLNLHIIYFYSVEGPQILAKAFEEHIQKNSR
jgi:hypothetical protein